MQIIAICFFVEHELDTSAPGILFVLIASYCNNLWFGLLKKNNLYIHQAIALMNFIQRKILCVIYCNLLQQCIDTSTTTTTINVEGQFVSSYQDKELLRGI